MTHGHVVTGVFPSTAGAEHARRRLVEAGVAESSIGLSTDLTADPVAAEFPGQSYANQPGQHDGGGEVDACSDAAHGGGCVVTVDVGAHADPRTVERIMRECGAQPRIAAL